MAKPIKVLIVEDTEDDAELILRELEHHDYEPVFDWVDTPEALNNSLDKHDWDIVLTDYAMPKFSGIDVIRLLKKKNLDIPLIIVSGAIGETVAIEAMKAGANDYIMKDNLARLVPAIEREINESAIRRQHKLAEEENHKLFRAIEQSPSSVLITDTNGNIEYVNPEFIKTTGYSHEEVIGENPRILKSGKQSPEVYKQLWDTITSGKEWRGDFLNKKKNGELFWETLSISSVKNDKGSITHFVCVKLDDTERRLTEESLKKSQASLAEAQRIAHIGNWTWKITSNEIEWSDEVYQIFGLTPQEFGDTYEAFLNYVHPDDIEMVKKSINKALYEKEPYSIVHRIVDQDGRERTVHEQAEVTFNNEEPIRMIGTVQDITERKKTEEELLKAEKLDSLGILAGGIAHDFNNILTIILGNINLAMMVLKPDDAVFKNLSRVENATIRAKDLTQQLLTFSKGGVPVKRTESISELIKESIEFVLRGSNVKCEFSIPDGIWPVDIDVGQINQVINNLIFNAMHAMLEGGTVDVMLENIENNNKLTTLSLTKGDYVKITVKDNGVGIQKDHLTKIFDPYFTTKQKGSGLGLASSYSIIKKHGGAITVDSELNNGTTFCIFIPASKEKLSEKKETEKHLLIGQGKLLIMDDEEVIRKTVSQMLHFIGYDVEVAEDGAAALEMYKKAREINKPFDAVILDITVPGSMGGKETVKKLLEIDPEAKAIVFSGYSNDPILGDFQKYGFKGAVNKPFKLQEMNEVLQKVMGSNQD